MENSSKGNPEKKNQKKPPLSGYAKYSALGFQMLVIIGGGAWLGKYLDEQSEREFPLYTVVITLLAVFIALYLTLREFIGKN